jgi:hypothetical protein
VSRQNKALIILGFAVALVSLVLSSYFIAQSNDLTAQHAAAASCLEDARRSAQANVIESASKIDAASTLFALSQQMTNSGAREHMQGTSRIAMESALCFTETAIATLDLALAGEPCEAPVVSCKDHSELLDAFFEVPVGVPEEYRKLIDLDNEYRNEWRRLDTLVRGEARHEATLVAAQARKTSMLERLGTGLGLLGLMIVMLRDIKG